MTKRISQSEIANKLGVSQSLVSLVLNGRRDCVAEESYRKIWETAVKHGYSPRGMQPVYSPDVQHGYVGIVTHAGQKLATASNTMSHDELDVVYQILPDYMVNCTNGPVFNDF